MNFQRQFGKYNSLFSKGKGYSINSAQTAIDLYKMNELVRIFVYNFVSKFAKHLRTC